MSTIVLDSTKSRIVVARMRICQSCPYLSECNPKIEEENVDCRTGMVKSMSESIREMAWPDSADRISGCCDSALNY